MSQEKLLYRRLTVGPAAENCYIVWAEGREDCLVIDPGDEGERLAAYTAELGLAPAAVLLTHGHFDHTGGLDGFAGVPVYLHPSDRPMLTDPSLSAGFLAGDDRVHSVDTLDVRDGQELTLAGMHVRVLETPGHTPGSVCYLVDEGSLFSGDTLFRMGWGRTDLPGGDEAKLYQSLKKLTGLPGELPVYPGHGQSTTIRDEARWL